MNSLLPPFDDQPEVEPPCETGAPPAFDLMVEHPPDPALVAEGWERRFMTDGQRLKEYAELYTSLGYEIHLAPVAADDVGVGPECSDCRLAICRQFVTLYTRRPR